MGIARLNPSYELTVLMRQSRSRSMDLLGHDFFHNVIAIATEPV